MPLLPVPYTGQFAVAEANPLSKSAERRQEEQKRSQARRRLSHDQCAIRDMTMDDLARVLEIEWAAFAVPYEERYFLAILQREHYFAYVAVDMEDSVMGYLTLKLRSNWVEIQSVAVALESRGLGVGRRLLETASSVATAYEANIRLHVSVWNHHAMRLYKSLGFQPSKWLFDYYAVEEEDAIEMHRLWK